MRLPAYGGTLFDPDRFPFLEGRAVDTEWLETQAKPLPIDNRTVLHLLESLQILKGKDAKGADALRLSFRSLDIEQVGHVYEGLLDHTAKRADEPILGLQGASGKEPKIPLSELESKRSSGNAVLIKFLVEATGRSSVALTKAVESQPGLEDGPVLRQACGNDDTLYVRVLPFASLLSPNTFDKPVVITTGSIFVTHGSDRRSTGTHYTPRSLTEPIVKTTLEPVVYNGVSDGTPPSPATLKTAREILNLKICDMTIGSGAFLVEACRYLSSRLVEAWQRDGNMAEYTLRTLPFGAASVGDPKEGLLPDNPDEMLTVARRLIVDRCLYGVDKNPMAAEMAKLSLWLITLERDRPFTFLDHAIKSGDSLVGVSLDELRAWEREAGLFGDQDLKKAADARGQLIGFVENDIKDYHQKQFLHAQAEKWIRRVRQSGDILLAPLFASKIAAEQKKLHSALLIESITCPTDDQRAVVHLRALHHLGMVKPFHWPLEFPEIFLRENGGFDAIIGNPPFMGGSLITGELGELYREYLVNEVGSGRRGNADIVAYFLLRAFNLLSRPHGFAGLITTDTAAQGETREVGLSRIYNSGCIIAAVRSMPWPSDASLNIAVVHIANGQWHGTFVLDGKPVHGINDLLRLKEQLGPPATLKENKKRSFTGSKPYGEGFVLTSEVATSILERDQRSKEVLFPYINGDDVNSRPDQSPSRWVINFGSMPQALAETYSLCFSIVRDTVLPYRLQVKRDRTRERWWLFEHVREELYSSIENQKVVLVCSEVTKHLAFCFVPTGSIFSANLDVFPTADYSDFAVLQSSLHESWARTYCSHLETRLKYSPGNAYETYPFPASCDRLGLAGEQYHSLRRDVMLTRDVGLTKLYNLFHDPTCNETEIDSLRRSHAVIDTIVLDMYGWSDVELNHNFYGEGKELRFTISPKAVPIILQRLLKLNHERSANEERLGVTKTRAQIATVSRKAGDPQSKQLTMDEHLAQEHPPVRTISQEDIEPAIFAYLIARERDPALLEELRPKPIRVKPYAPIVAPIHSVRLAKEEYGTHEMVGVSFGLEFKRENNGPLSTTFYTAIDRASAKGWLIKQTGSYGDSYELGPNAKDAIRIAFSAIGDREQSIVDMLFYIDNDPTIEAERQMTVHKVWADLRRAGKQATQAEVIRDVEEWKPNRYGFTRQEIMTTFSDLKARGMLKASQDNSHTYPALF